MNNLALSYGDLGRHNEALAMRESVLEFIRRVLPEDHPDIGEGHVRSGDAFALLNMIFLFTGSAFYNLSFSYEQCDALPRALEYRDVKNAEERFRRLEQATQLAGHTTGRRCSMM